ncbi:endonuclease/exonuclease/phosphatase family protein [Tellurirhabdus rosea]|uniref:endonuclease/exonuclease/phosphatase family protein n=1 Tax=Tellurirhabdus rosea TaxID=2674997 RepID=UPI002251A522|nr:endonuclease/exonuclease/phosphatase family protein [Tellurirhabdus rosea]
MNYSDWFFLVSGVLLVIASFINLSRNEAWWVRIWDFPHLQLALLALLWLLGWLVMDGNGPVVEWILPALMIAALLYQSWLVFPYTQLHRVQVMRYRGESPGRTIKLMIANIYMDNRHYRSVLQHVQRHQPDLLLIVEADDEWCQALTPLEAQYPHRVLKPLPNTYGMLLYSRLRLHQPQVRFLVEDDIPSVRTFVELPSGEKILFYGVHPQPPSPTENDRSTERDAELLMVGKEARSHEGPVIVAGDLNDVAWSHTTRLFQRVSGLLDPRVGRGLFSTFHAKYFFLRWPLDHVFASVHFKVKAIQRLPSGGSDHFPIFITLVYDPAAPLQHDEPQPEEGDREEAREKIQKV